MGELEDVRPSVQAMFGEEPIAVARVGSGWSDMLPWRRRRIEVSTRSVASEELTTVHGLRFVGSGVICATPSRVVGWNEQGEVVGNAPWITLDTVELSRALFRWGRATVSFRHDYSTVALPITSAVAESFVGAIARQRLAKVLIDSPPDSWLLRLAFLVLAVVVGGFAILFGAGVLGDEPSPVWIGAGAAAVVIALLLRRVVLRRKTFELRTR